MSVAPIAGTGASPPEGRPVAGDVLADSGAGAVYVDKFTFAFVAGLDADSLNSLFDALGKLDPDHAVQTEIEAVLATVDQTEGAQLRAVRVRNPIGGTTWSLSTRAHVIMQDAAGRIHLIASARIVCFPRAQTYSIIGWSALKSFDRLDFGDPPRLV